jgi:hypothetical protein
LSDKIGTEASIISKEKGTRKLVHSFQIKSAYQSSKKTTGDLVWMVEISLTKLSLMLILNFL